MISTKRIAQMAKKWQRMAALDRKRLAWQIAKKANECSVAGKGHCVVYTADGRRFEVPLTYLGTTVFAELLQMSQEEFGFVSDGRITLPCDTAVCHVPAQKRHLSGSREGISEDHGSFMPLCKLCSLISRN